MQAPLGRLTSIASTSLVREQVRAYVAKARAKQQDLVRTQAQSITRSKAKRFALQNVVRDLMPADHRINVCLRMVTPGSRSVEVWHSKAHGQAHYKKLVVCGSIWSCPVCAAKISERRRDELARALRSSAHKYTAVLVTVTLSHGTDDALESLVADLNNAYRSLHSGRWYQDLKQRYGIAGSVSSLEVTVSRHAGWHPHRHALFFCAPGVNVDQLQSELKVRWQQVINSHARFANYDNGLTAVQADEHASQYLAKQDQMNWTASHELTKANSKTGSSGDHYHPFELLDRFAIDRDRWYADKFREYVSAFTGRHQLQWSRGMRSLLGLDEAVISDAELAERAEDDSTFMAALALTAWRKVLANDIRAELLEVAGSGDVYELTQWLEMFGISPDEINTKQDGET